MNDHPLSQNELDAEAQLLRPLLCRPPWHRGAGSCDHRHLRKEDIDTGTRALFRRYSPGTPPHALSPEIRGAVWQRVAFFPDPIGDDEAAQSRAVDHAALGLHLLARGPAGSPDGLDLGTACRAAGLTDTRFTRLMGTPQPRRLEALSRLMQRLEKAGTPLRWMAAEDDPAHRSRPWNVRDTQTDEVYAVLNFLFGYDPDPSIARWAAGFFRTQSDTDPAGDAQPTPETL